MFKSHGYCLGTDWGNNSLVPPGFYKPKIAFTNSMYACPAGYFSSQTGSSACTACSLGMYSFPGASECMGPCPRGTYFTPSGCALAPIGAQIIYSLRCSCHVYFIGL